ncbi:right-handed parallel beta-helix repeat-containing protein [Actinocatenispora rupis]|uniref:Sugar hydrolase n=1 Tax=Actinocatenispora rupis TaxID=519421 RepID=A0A8J3J079_9ACTN|nr:right-handed parallel beta-helix repeat-containing protein [Actinocatenispora rupis]GID12120.1 sugar hydrolase [Actinocatenispora rupis]
MRRTVRILTLLGALAVGAVPASSGVAAAAGPTTYYVSPAGDDTAAGTTTSAPFQHIQRCAEVLVAGDTCEVMSGTYRETVTPAASGTSGAPITYRAYPGASVRVDGTDPVTGFAQVTAADLAGLEGNDPYLTGSGFATAVGAGQVYRTTVSLNADASLDQIFVDDQMYVQAQWPYPGLDLLNPTVELTQAGTTNTTIADANLTRPAGYWDGATVLMSYWYATQTGTVASSAPGSVTLASAAGCAGINAGDTRYALSGKLGELAHPGEWYYDPPTGHLYVYGNPSGHTVLAKSRTYGFDLRAASYTTVQGIDLFGSTIATSGTGNVVDGVHARYVSHYTQLTAPGSACNVSVGVTTSGIQLRGSGNVVRNSSVDGSAGTGILLAGTGNTADDNKVSNVDYLGTYASGIAVTGSGAVVTHNTVSDVGRAAVSVVWGSGFSPVTVAYNDLSGYDHLSTDGAAVYLCCNADMAGTSVHHNWLHDAANIPGINPFAEAGAYADNGQRDIAFYDNVGWNNLHGTVMLHGQAGVSTDNLVYDNDGGVYLLGITSAAGTRVVNNLGDVANPPDASTGITISHNLPAATDPLYVDAAGHDYRLQAGSPARNAAEPIPGITDGSTDPTPSLGAYQYGAVRWVPGATW